MAFHLNVCMCCFVRQFGQSAQWEWLVEHQHQKPSFDHRGCLPQSCFLRLVHQPQRAKILKASKVSKPNQKPNLKHLSPCKPETGPCISNHSIFEKSYKSDWFIGWCYKIYSKAGGRTGRAAEKQLKEMIKIYWLWFNLIHSDLILDIVRL